MRGLKKVDVGPAVRFLEEGGSVARAFTESLEIGGIIREDILKVAAATTATLNCGLTRDALLLLIQAQCPRPHGRPMPKDVINDVLEAMARLDEHLDPKPLPSDRKVSR